MSDPIHMNDPMLNTKLEMTEAEYHRLINLLRRLYQGRNAEPMDFRLATRLWQRLNDNL